MCNAKCVMRNEFFNYIESMSRKFLLCFHDISVWNYQKVLPEILSLKDLCGRGFSLLVIPCTDGAAPDAVRGFRDTLLQLESQGFELALHGYKHKAEFSQGRSYMGLVGMSVTGGEAEFAGLCEYESARLLQCGLKAWEDMFSAGETDAGLVVHAKPVAFVPPTWYSNKYLPRQVRDARMLYEDRFSLTTAKGFRYASPVASFAGLPASLEKVSIAFGSFIMKLPFGIPRLALHPTDFPQKNGVIRDIVRVAQSNRRKLVHYSEL